MLLIQESVWVWKKKQHNIGFPSFKLPSITKDLLWLTHLKSFLNISVYDYQAIGSSLVVCIFHKGIISYVLCGYEVQMNMFVF